MKSEHFKAKFTRNVLPVMVAVVVMALILVTVPLTSTPASVFGGYGGWAGRMSDPTQWYKYASFANAPAAGHAVGNSEPTLATVVLDGAAIRDNNVDPFGFTLDGVQAASWSLSGAGDLVLSFNLPGLYSTGDLVTLKYNKDGRTFTIAVTVK